jgi:hypothetical protein
MVKREEQKSKGTNILGRREYSYIIENGMPDRKKLKTKSINCCFSIHS